MARLLALLIIAVLTIFLARLTPSLAKPDRAPIPSAGEIPVLETTEGSTIVL